MKNYKIRKMKEEVKPLEEINENLVDVLWDLMHHVNVDRELDLIIDALEEIGNKLSLYIDPTQNEKVVEEETYDFGRES